MAEALVSTILEQLASLQDGVKIVVDWKEVLQQLTSNFLKIRSVLRDAETRHMKNEGVRNWLDKLKDASYDLEDALEEWSTTIRKIGDGNTSKSFSKVCCSMPCNLSYCREVALLSHIAAKIKVLSKTLDIMATETDKYDFSKIEEPDLTESDASSVIDLPDFNICEREEEKKKLLDLLFSERRQGPIFPIISIVGMRGSGKTTLAQQVFHTKEVNTRFDMKIWVCVSNFSDEIGIATAILKHLNSVIPNQDELDILLQKIQKSFERKKFLLVLDDLRIKRIKYCKEIRHFLRKSGQGSKILVTTHERNVAKMIGTTNLISLGKFSHEDYCWSLFSKIAFHERSNCEDFHELEAIGKKIVSKCNGLPHTLKVLGGLVRMKTRAEEWKKILDSGFWKLEDMKKGFFSSILLSYYDLPTKLRKCFSCCAIFPKDYRLKKDTLIKLWMAQGYLKEDENMENVGEKYFHNLAMRSFFHDFKRSEHNNKIISCKMPDAVHDFAQFLAKNECCMIKVDGRKGFQFNSSYEKVRHIKIIEKSTSTSCFKKGKLLSLIKCRINSKVGVDLSKLFEQLTCLRTLDLSGCSFEDILGEIKKLIHLRYLNLSRNKAIKELPEALWELNSLQTLNISDCDNLIKNLSPGIGKLTKLLHLINYGTPLSYVPKEVVQLTCLRTLSKFAVSNEKDDKRACKLKVLEKLNHLEGFLIITGLGNVSDKDEVNNAKLNEMQSLVGLCLRFDGLTHVDDEALFKDLDPPPNLEELMVQYYIGQTMSLERLKRMEKLKVLKLSFCLEFEDLTAIGELPFLETLCISNMKKVKCVGKEFLVKPIDGASTSPITGTAFPKLRTLKFDSMDEWVNWEDITIMPCLQSLTIGHCQKLEALPAKILVTLRKLKMYNCSRLNALHNKNTGKEWSKISHIPNIAIDGELVQKDGS